MFGDDEPRPRWLRRAIYGRSPDPPAEEGDRDRGSWTEEMHGCVFLRYPPRFYCCWEYRSTGRMGTDARLDGSGCSCARERGACVRATRSAWLRAFWLEGAEVCCTGTWKGCRQDRLSFCYDVRSGGGGGQGPVAIFWAGDYVRAV